jgi:hypothetical protein
VSDQPGTEIEFEMVEGHYGLRIGQDSPGLELFPTTTGQLVLRATAHPQLGDGSLAFLVDVDTALALGTQLVETANSLIAQRNQEKS